MRTVQGLPTCEMRACARPAVILTGDGYLCCVEHGGEDETPRLDLRPMLAELDELRAIVARKGK